MLQKILISLILLLILTQATQTVAKKNGLLTIPEVDNNFINLKKSALALEREVQHLGEQTEEYLKADIDM